MKNLFCFILTAFAVCASAGTTDEPKFPSGADTCIVKCTYKLTFKPDSLSSNTISDYHVLLIGKRLSQYTSKSSLAVDSLTNVYEAQPLNQQTVQNFGREYIKLARPLITFNIFKDKVNSNIYFIDQLSSTTYYITEPNSVFKWVIEPTILDVSGYKCKRATTVFAGRKYEAWFTSEIPVSDGPYKFTGLPGLIVKVRDFNDNYVFQLLKASKISANINKINIVMPSESKCVKTTKQEFRNGQRNYSNNRSVQSNPPGSVTINGRPSQGTNRAAPKSSNALELK